MKIVNLKGIGACI